MNKKSSFFLLLKQGIKGVFKFKVQFIIILVLSFLATFIFTTSYTVSQRINGSYNNIVKSIKRFDETTSMTVGSRSKMDEDIQSLSPLSDFIDSGFVNYTSKDGSNKSDYSFSFNTINNKNNQVTFLTSTFANEKFKEEFAKLQLTFDEGVNGDAYKNMRNILVDEMIKAMSEYSQDNNVNSYLKNTTFGNLIRKDKDFIKNIENGTDTTTSSYINMTASTVINWVKNQGVQFGQDLMDKYNSDKFAELLYLFITGNQLNGTITGTEALVVSETNKYLTDIKLGQEYNQQDENRYLQVLTNQDAENAAPLNEVVVSKGLRGIVNPISVKTFESEGQVVLEAAFFLGNNSEFKMNNYNTKHPSIGQKLSAFSNYELPFMGKDFWINFTVDDGEEDNHLDIRASMFQYHLELTAKASGLDIRFRKEAFAFDSITQTKYRAVTLNEKDDANFTILTGRMPTTKGEIAISEQYARAHHIPLGKTLRIADATFTVVALATDAFSYFPTADPDFPVPQTEVSAIIYGYRDTLRAISAGSSSSQADKTVTETFTFFLTNPNKKSGFWNNILGKDSQNETNNKIAKFVALQKNVPSSLKDSYEYITSFKEGKAEINDAVRPRTFFSLTKFDDSNYALNWTIQPRVMGAYNAITMAASAIIAIIALIALIICIRKTIMFNSKQIGILKALGVNPSTISASYIAHSLIIAFIVIPLGWLVGLAMQVPFMYMFSDYFSAPYMFNQFLFDFGSLGITFAVFGVVAIAISFISAFLITNQSVMEILKVSVKWSSSKTINKLKDTIFKNSKFTLKFSLTLASSGKKPIALLVTVVALSSVLISTGLAIPAIAMNAKDSYYKSVNYANSYKYNDVTANSPFSKKAINFWDGHDDLDTDYTESDLNLDGSGTGYGYYINPENYSASINDINPISRYVYKTDVESQKSVQNTMQYLVENKDELIGFITKIFGDNFFNNLGQSFSIGMIDQFFGLILNSLENPYDKNEAWTDENKVSFSQEFSGFITKAVPQLISAIMGSADNNEAEAGKDANWKRQIIDTILVSLPPYVKGYVQEESRLDQYSIGWNVEHFIPTEESLSTQVSLNTKSKKEFVISGLDKTQSAFNIDKSDKEKTFLDIKTQAEVEKVFQGKATNDIYFNKTKIYDYATNTLTAPIVTNAQAKAAFNISEGTVVKDVSTTSTVLKYQSNEESGFSVLPNSAWVYNDSDYVNSDYATKNPMLDAQAQKQYKESIKTRTGAIDENYLDPFAIDTNKFTFSQQYDGKRKEVGNAVNALDPTQPIIKNATLKDKTYLFNDFSYNEDGELDSSFVRPYYQYDNLEIFVPVSKLGKGGVEGFINGMNKDHRSTNDENTWYSVVENEVVPTSVKEGYDNATGKYLLVRPFDISYNLDSQEMPQNDDGSLGNLLNGPKYWFRFAFEGINPALNQQKAKVTYANKDLKVNLKSVGNMTSYNEKVIVVDSTIANLIAGYSTARKIGVNYTYFDENPVIKANVDDQVYGKSRFDRYNFKTVDNQIYTKNWESLTYMGEEAQNYAPMYWNNFKFSNIEEPLGLTSGVSYTTPNNIGQNAIGLESGDIGGVVNGIKSQTLLSTSKALINQISVLAISIGMMLIIAVIITAALLIMLVGDIYIMQYQRFMILMKVLGYSNWKIQKYSFGTVTMFSLFMWLLATVLAWGLMAIAITVIANMGFAIPYGISWWPPIASFAIISISFLGSLLVSSKKVRNGNPASLMTDSAE
ncbi:FtsX-like permease family protein [[Acholeplasma] multilocale]|uniref:FtsX-like permease family protein n=1 Tax=[Acholeplasma] multilocale TaxID=264638 RepID=UPI00047E4F5E|nr:ABC transporter permease [[Acholeplasma] multilocale]